ncbi:M23 family metallopeptidase [uncultured Tenacibaculum sp.]|uniref:M23 family metallopeptidase n=1 Tax=uncultured Tenacibaculum sp. TaxID=174713 RepID=UPI002617CBA3|nr:M23 family metallopeptidase [uncultured Tenacibaculum sp.]
MKKTICLLLTISNVLIISAQKKLKNTKIVENYINHVKNDSLEENTKKEVFNNECFTENWVTTQFTAYVNPKVKFPFEIKFSDSTYASPISKKRVITSRYGWRRNRPHRGIDIDLVTGDSVFSILPGKVRFVGRSSGYGKTVVIRHDNGLESVYAHLSGFIIKKNDIVKKGQAIAFGGNTGRSRGSHLHLETRYKGIAINPEYLLDLKNSNKIRAKNLWVTRDWAKTYYHSSKRQSRLVTLDSYEKALAYKKRKRKVYIVKSGDTLSGIAYRNRTSISRICKTNKIRKTTTLRIGQKLII